MQDAQPSVLLKACRHNLVMGMHVLGVVTEKSHSVACRSDGVA